MGLLSFSNGASMLKIEKTFPINNKCWQHRHSAEHKMNEGDQSPVWKPQITYVSVLLNGASFCRKGCSNSGRCENVPLLVVKRNILHVPLGKCARIRPPQSKYPILCTSAGCFVQRGAPGNNSDSWWAVRLLCLVQPDEQCRRRSVCNSFLPSCALLFLDLKSFLSSYLDFYNKSSSRQWSPLTILGEKSHLNQPSGSFANQMSKKHLNGESLSNPWVPLSCTSANSFLGQPERSGVTYLWLTGRRTFWERTTRW